MIDMSLVKPGTVILTEGERKRTVDHYDGKLIHFLDGSAYSWRHPGLTEIVTDSEDWRSDMEGWTLSALKSYCSENEIPCKGCKTKSDYLDAIGIRFASRTITEEK